MKERPINTSAIIVMIVATLVFVFGRYKSIEWLQSLGALLLLAGAVLMTNSNNRTIAVNTFREALRNKVLYIILIFTILLIGFAVVLASISIGENARVIKHVGLSAINLLGIFLAMFVGVNLVYDEMEKRTIYMIIAHGVPRQDFIIGKFLGFFLTIIVNFVLMGAILSVVLWMKGYWHEAVLYAVFMSVFEMMIIISFAILFSSFSTPVISAILTLGVYVIGHLSDALLEHIKNLGHEAYAAHADILIPLYNGIYYILPHLEEFNAKSHVHDPIQMSYTLFPVGYGVLYTVVVLYLASIIFSKKDFH